MKYGSQSYLIGKVVQNFDALSVLPAQSWETEEEIGMKPRSYCTFHYDLRDP